MELRYLDRDISVGWGEEIRETVLQQKVKVIVVSENGEMPRYEWRDVPTVTKDK